MIAPANYAFLIGLDRVVDDDTLGFYNRWCPELMIARPLPPDETYNLSEYAPDVLAHRNRMLEVNYRPIDGELYRLVLCPDGSYRRDKQ